MKNGEMQPKGVLGMVRSRRQALTDGRNAAAASRYGNLFASAMEMGSRAMRVAAQNPGVVFDAAQRGDSALARTGGKLEEADSSAKTESPFDEEALLAVDGMFGKGVEIAKTIVDQDLRIATLLNIGKAELKAFGMPLNASGQLVYEPRNSGADIARATLFRDAGHYETAVRIYSESGQSFSNQWHLDTAVHKAEQRKLGKTDLDPDDDLKIVRERLPKSMDGWGPNALYADIGRLADYAVAHFRVHNVVPEQLQLSRSLFNELRDITRGQESMWSFPASGLQYAESLARAYSACGSPHNAYTVIDEIPRSVEGQERRIRVLDQIVNDGYERSDLSSINSHGQIVVRAIQWVPNRRVRMRLMMEVGVNAQMTRAVLSTAINSAEEMWPPESYEDLSRKVRELIENTPDPILRASGYRMYGNRIVRVYNKGENARDYFRKALEELNRVKRGGGNAEINLRLAQGYKDLVHDLSHNVFLNQAGEALAQMEDLQDGGQASALYAQALADVAESMGTQMQIEKRVESFKQEA